MESRADLSAEVSDLPSLPPSPSQSFLSETPSRMTARASKESLYSLLALWTADGLTGLALLDAYMDAVTEDYVNSLFPTSRAVLWNYLITHDVRIKKGRRYAAQRILLPWMIDQADDQHVAVAHLPDRTDGANASDPNDVLQISHTNARGRHNTTETLPDSVQNKNPIAGT
jgi:hypothetical protein